MPGDEASTLTGVRVSFSQHKFTGAVLSEIDVSADQLVRALSISRHQLRALVRARVLPRPRAGGHPLRASAIAFLKTLDTLSDDVVADARRREIAARTAILEIDLLGASTRQLRGDYSSLKKLLASVDDPDERSWCEFGVKYVFEGLRNG